MAKRNSKGQFVKRSSGAAVGARSGGARRGGGKRGSRAISFARRAGSRARGMLPAITPMRVVKVTGGLMAGTALRKWIDVPYVSEEALGVLGVAMFSGPAEKGILADVAIALQAKELLDRFGVTDSIVGFITPGASPSALPPGAPVFDANGNQVGVA